MRGRRFLRLLSSTCTDDDPGRESGGERITVRGAIFFLPSALKSNDYRGSGRGEKKEGGREGGGSEKKNRIESSMNFQFLFISNTRFCSSLFCFILSFANR